MTSENTSIQEGGAEPVAETTTTDAPAVTEAPVVPDEAAQAPVEPTTSEPAPEAA